MKSFVQSFSVLMKLTKEEYASLFEQDKTLFIYKNEITWKIKGYESCGLSATVLSSEDYYLPLPKYDIGNPYYQLQFIVTLAKLLAPNRNLGGITDKCEIEDACKKWNEIVRKIEKTSGVNLMDKTELCWVTLEKDVVTPNEFYTHEIIDLARYAFDEYGYKKNQVNSTNLSDCEAGENYITLYSDALYTVRNKKHDLSVNKCQSEVKNLGEHGLLSFELFLPYHILIDDYFCPQYITPDVLPEVLYQLTADSNMLFNEYFGNAFYNGAILSRSVLKKCLKEKYKKSFGKEKIKDLIALSNLIRRRKIAALEKHFTFNQIHSQIAELARIKISPVTAGEHCPYIPSFSNMINDAVDDELLAFALKATEHEHEELACWDSRQINQLLEGEQ